MKCAVAAFFHRIITPLQLQPTPQQQRAGHAAGAARFAAAAATLPEHTCNTTTFRFKMDGLPFIQASQHVKNESGALGKAKPGKVSRVSVATFLDLGFGLKVVADLLGMGRKFVDDSASNRPASQRQSHTPQ